MFIFSLRLMEHWISVGYLQVMAGILSPTLLPVIMSSDAHSTVQLEAHRCSFCGAVLFCGLGPGNNTFKQFSADSRKVNSRLQVGNAHCVSRPWVRSCVSFITITSYNKHLRAIGMAGRSERQKSRRRSPTEQWGRPWVER